jgi:hypothetical protein
MLLLSSVLRSIKGALTPNRSNTATTRKRMREDEDVNVTSKEDDQQQRLEVGDGDRNKTLYSDILPSVGMGKRPFVWKQFPAPSPRGLKSSGGAYTPVPERLGYGMTNSGRDDVPEFHVGSAIERKMVEEDGRGRVRDDVVEVRENAVMVPEARRDDSAAHFEFYGRFLNRMQEVLGQDGARGSEKNASTSSKAAYEYHRDRIQKLAQKATSLLDYSAADRIQNELQEIEDSISRIRKLRLKPKSEVSYKRVVPLPQFSDGEKARFNELVSHAPDEAVLKHEASRVSLKGSDLSRLRPGCWLNDEIINLYMRLLQERDTRLHENQKGEEYPKCHFFNSFFLSKLYKDAGMYEYNNVRRWTVPGRLKAVGQSRSSILDCDKIIVPVNQCNVHWVVAVINLEEKRFEYYDSLNGEDSECLNYLAQYLVDEFKNKRSEDRKDILEWPKVYPKSIPKQVNGYDCGVFLLLFSDYLSKAARLDFSQEHINDFRVKLAMDFTQMEVA